MSMKYEEPTTLLIADDDDIFRQGLALVLNDIDIQVVSTCSTYEECVEQIRNRPPRVALIDMHFHGCKQEDDCGLMLLEEVKVLSPSTRCIILTGSDNDGKYLPAAYLAGAYGYLRKGRVVGRLLPDMIKMVASGQFVYDARLAKAILSWFDHIEDTNNGPTMRDDMRLTPREKEIMRLVAIGYENKEIAEELVVAVTTVKTHIQNVLLKCQLHDRERAAMYYVMTDSLNNDKHKK